MAALSDFLFCFEHIYFTFLEQYYLQIQGTAMGASFAPSYANLTMGGWEESCIWRNNALATHLAFCGRSIDDVIIIWDGPSTEIASFVQYCNGLSFTHVHNSVPCLRSILAQPLVAT